MTKKWLGLIFIDQLAMASVIASSELYGNFVTLVFGLLVQKFASLVVAICLFNHEPQVDLQMRRLPFFQTAIIASVLSLVGIACLLANIFFTKYLTLSYAGVSQFADVLAKIFFNALASSWSVNFLGALAILNSTVVVPIFEEFMFRVVLYAIFRKRYSPTISVLLVAITFALFHMKLPFAAFFFSIALSVAVLRMRSLFPGCIAHGIANYVAMSIVFGQKL